MKKILLLLFMPVFNGFFTADAINGTDEIIEISQHANIAAIESEVESYLASSQFTADIEAATFEFEDYEISVHTLTFEIEINPTPPSVSKWHKLILCGDNGGGIYFYNDCNGKLIDITGQVLNPGNGGSDDC